MTEIQRPVFFSGENPGMTLYFPGTEQIAAVASYWQCTDSPMGVGHALVVWIENPDQPGEPAPGSGIWTDNLALAEKLVETLTRHFPEFETIPVSRLKYLPAVCTHTYDGDSYRVKCQTSATQITLTWSTPLDRKQILWKNFPTGESAYDLTTVICPCRAGEIQFKGQAVTGQVSCRQTESGQWSSSAFLAFAETWVGPVA